MRRAAVLAFLALAACVRQAPVMAPVEVTVGAAGARETSKTPAPSGTQCTAKLVALDIDTGVGCVLDERISKGDGTLHYPCAGDGPASATFGEHSYEGAVKGGTLALSITTELDWEGDHCRWQSQQAIHGVVSDGELAWTYADTAIKGESCSGACTARAIIEIDPDPDRPRESERPDEPDED